MADGTHPGSTAPTPHGPMQYLDEGSGAPVLFVHGSPGGSDQGSLMGGFLVAGGYRVVSPSRPGYHGTPLTDDNATPERQAEMELSVMDGLGIDRFAVACWSGGGASSYTLASHHPERVSAVAAIAAVSGPYTWEHPKQESMLTGRFGAWLMKELSRHAPREVVKQLVSSEGELDKDERRKLVGEIWDDEAKREWALALMASITGDRRDGLRNDQEQFPKIGDLGLASITAPTLLVHATTDADVPISHSEHAALTIPGAELVRVEGGTHVSVWTDPGSDDLQERIAGHLRAHAGR
jgi:pimeloyl-ACP methyl ester carboxylesterase